MRTFWNDEKVKKSIFECMSALNIERMPTAEEFKMLERNDLHCKISKGKKYRGWADELGLELKSCETRFGQKYEELMIERLENLDFEVERMTTKYPYDLLIDGCVKVDVKVAKPFMLKGESRVHTFNLQKPNATCDIYICILLDEEEKEERIFIIPSHLVKIKTLCVGKESSYNKFIDTWQYIAEYSRFFKEVTT